VFLSIRKDQADQREYKKFQHIYDVRPFKEIGPLGGMLSAMKKYPQQSWLIIGCDLPFINEATIKHLIQKRNKRKWVTAYRSSYDKLPEPLCAIYETKAQGPLKRYFYAGGKCPRKFLIKSSVQFLKQPQGHALDNINEPQEYQNAMKKLQS
jgi:molybdopterin-guanine dinucleotide biosynthesis protein A